MYELYEEMVKAQNDERLFSAAVRNFLEACEENPFEGEAHQYFFEMKKYYKKWRNGGIDMRSSKRNMVAAGHKLMTLNLPNPFIKGEETFAEPAELPKIEEPAVEQKINEPEITPAELKEDMDWLMANMVNAHLRGDEPSYEMYVTHLMDIAQENPFLLGTDEYELFSQMMATYRRNPPNKRKTFVVGKQLCDLINNTELYPEKIEKPKQTVLGVLPDEEKKSWLQFLFPWRKEGEQDDSSRAD